MLINYSVVSPAIIDVTQGTPNQIIIEGNEAFSATDARLALDDAWKNIVETVRLAIETALPHQPYHWQQGMESLGKSCLGVFLGRG